KVGFMMPWGKVSSPSGFPRAQTLQRNRSGKTNPADAIRKPSAELRLAPKNNRSRGRESKHREIRPAFCGFQTSDLPDLQRGEPQRDFSWATHWVKMRF